MLTAAVPAPAAAAALVVAVVERVGDGVGGATQAAVLVLDAGDGSVNPAIHGPHTLGVAHPVRFRVEHVVGHCATQFIPDSSENPVRQAPHTFAVVLQAARF